MSKKIDPRELQPNISFEIESIDCVLERYVGFGRELVATINSQYKEVVNDFVFLKDISSNDVWAFYTGDKNQFGFQIDPDCEVIIIWLDENEFQEFGSWSENPVKQAFGEINKIISGVRT